MASQAPDPNMFTALFMLTKSLHRDVYPAVDPTNPELSATGKVVIITGASGGIGYAIATAWSLAGASGIVLAGRNVSTLKVTAASLKTPSLVCATSITSATGCAELVEKAVKEFGHVDVLVNAAGTMNQEAMIGEVDCDLWWSDFESNVRGTYNITHAFIKATGGKGTVVNLVSLGASFLVPGISSYSASKLAAIKLTECLDLELPNLRVFSLHPGIVEASGSRGMPLLTGGVTLYLSTPRADFLRGGFVSVNWDVEELEAHKAQLAEKKLTKLAFLNGQLQPGGYPWTA